MSYVTHLTRLTNNGLHWAREVAWPALKQGSVGLWGWLKRVGWPLLKRWCRALGRWLALIGGHLKADAQWLGTLIRPWLGRRLALLKRQPLVAQLLATIRRWPLYIRICYGVLLFCVAGLLLTFIAQWRGAPGVESEVIERPLPLPPINVPSSDGGASAIPIPRPRPPPPDRIDQAVLIDDLLVPWTGDLDGMAERGGVRALGGMSRTLSV